MDKCFIANFSQVKFNIIVQMHLFSEFLNLFKWDILDKVHS
jgi:hypothetical protein